MVQRLNINNFFKHYIIRPLEAPKIDRLKAVISSIAIGILTCGLVHLSVFIKQLCIKKIELLNSLQKRVSQFNPSKADIIKSNNEVEKFLNEKKNTYKEQPEIQQKIHTKKAELKDLRKDSPQKYPSYLDDLLVHGYIHTYEHLIQLQGILEVSHLRKTIEKMSFSEVVHIVLEIREYFITILKNSIPKNSDKILFLLGPTGAGKSTTLCFLRGDEMALKGSSYESKNDNEGLIGHELATSRTFLPKVELINGLTFVDFPGFYDTKGPVITLGIEIALKALINLYKPRILVVESITDVEGRFKNAAKLGSKLKRLFKNPESCTLGITKYSKNISYQKIKDIEKQEKQATPEELKLLARIEVLVEDLQDETNPQKILELEQKKLELENKLQMLVCDKSLNAHNTPEKTTCLKNIQEDEYEFSRQIGVPKILKLLDFENKDYLQVCLDALFNSANDNPRLNPHLRLDNDERDVLDTLFKKNLSKELRSYTPHQKYVNNIESFYQNVSDYSLIYTIASSEIGSFLHLSEMDPNVALEYDCIIIDECVQNYMRATIGGLHLSVLEKILNKAKTKLNVEKIQMQIKKYKEYIQGLLAIEPIEDQKQAEEEWEKIEQRYRVALEIDAEKFKLPNWAIAGLSIPNVEITIHKLWQKYGVNSECKELLEELTHETLDQFCSELKHIQLVFSRIKKLEIGIKIKKHQQNENIANQFNLADK